MANPQALLALQNVPLFRSCSKQEVRRIARLSDEARVPAGKMIIREGTAGHEFFLLLDGEVQVTRAGAEVAVLGPGAFFGELALLVRAPRDASVTTLTPCALLVIGAREFSGLLADAPTLTRKLLEGMARRLVEADRAAGGPAAAEPAYP